MSAIAPGLRETITPDEFRATVERYGLVPAAAGLRLFVLVPGVSRSRPGQEQLTPSEWLVLFDSQRDPVNGRPMLKIVRNSKDPRFIGVAFTDAGRREWHAQRSYGAKSNRLERRRIRRFAR